MILDDLIQYYASSDSFNDIGPDQDGTKLNYFNINMMASQWAETLVEIRVTLADIRGTTK